MTTFQQVEHEQGLYVDVLYTGRSRRPAPEQHDNELQPRETTTTTTTTTTPSSSGGEGSRGSDGRFSAGTVIRVYPFVLNLTENRAILTKLQFLGTEHDDMQWVTIPQLEQLTPTVPALAKAFHHATAGRYLNTIPTAVREWANDRVSGAATLARRATYVVEETPGADPAVMKFLRPSMVALVNVLQAMEPAASSSSSPSTSSSTTTTTAECLTPLAACTSLEHEATRAVDLAVERIMARIRQTGRCDTTTTDIGSSNKKNGKQSFVIGALSRSSTLVSILKKLFQAFENDPQFQISVVCSQSSPGDEGILMAQDLGNGVACVVSDEEMVQKVKKNEIDLILVGCDCIMEHAIVNKVGTAALARAAQESTGCPVLCCSDRWKLWDDVFPAPLEPIFELIPRALFDEVIVPAK